jgi:hypothetical protein
MPANSSAPESRCARCGAPFDCGMRSGAGSCWCAALPPLAPVAGRACLCRRCLTEELRAAPPPAR